MRILTALLAGTAICLGAASGLKDRKRSGPRITRADPGGDWVVLEFDSEPKVPYIIWATQDFTKEEGWFPSDLLRKNGDRWAGFSIVASEKLTAVRVPNPPFPTFRKGAVFLRVLRADRAPELRNTKRADCAVYTLRKVNEIEFEPDNRQDALHAPAAEFAPPAKE